MAYARHAMHHREVEVVRHVKEKKEKEEESGNCSHYDCDTTASSLLV